MKSTLLLISLPALLNCGPAEYSYSQEAPEERHTKIEEKSSRMYCTDNHCFDTFLNFSCEVRDGKCLPLLVEDCDILNISAISQDLIVTSSKTQKYATLNGKFYSLKLKELVRSWDGVNCGPYINDVKEVPSSIFATLPQ